MRFVLRFGRILAALMALAIVPPALAQEVAPEGGDGDDALPAPGAPLEALRQRADEAPAEGSEGVALCEFLHRRGMARLRLGRMDDAIADMKQALTLAPPYGQTASRDKWCDRWRLQADIAGGYRQAGDPVARIEHTRQLGEELKKANLRRYFFTLNWLVADYVDIGLLAKADDALRQAGDLLPQLRKRRDWATEEYNILNHWHLHSAYLQALRGNFAEAERLRREALKEAYLYLDVRSQRDGKDSQVLRVARGLIANSNRQLANALAGQGRFSEAEFFAREGLARMREYATENSPEVIRALSNLGMIKMQQGRLDIAEDYLRQALAGLDGAQVRAASPLLADVRANLAFVLQMRARWAESLVLFEARDKGLRSNPAQFARSGSLRTDWAMALLRQGRSDEAVDMLERIVRHYQRVSFADPQLVARANGYLAVALAAKGDDARALALFASVLPVLMQQIAGDSEGDGLGAGRQFRITTILEAYLALLARQHVAGDGTAAAKAFAVADIARASSVQRAVAASSARAELPDPALADLARREQDAGNRKGGLTRVLARLAAAPEGQRNEGIIADLRRDIERLAGEQEALRRELAERYPDYLNLIAPQAASLAAVQAALRPGEAMLALYAAQDVTYAWTLSAQKAHFAVVKMGRDAIDAEVARIREAVDLGDGTPRRFAADAAHALYSRLLAPGAALWADGTTLNVVPHGSLGRIPFSLLLTDKPVKDLRAAPWLIRRIAIAQQPSASAFLALRTRAAPSAAARSFVGFGDPLFSNEASGEAAKVRRLALRKAATLRDARGGLAGEDVFARLAPLPDTRAELEDMARTANADPVADLYLGPRASEQNVKKSRLADYRIVAFATHGLIPGELVGLDQPALALARPELAGDAQNDGLLTMEEVLGLRLDADWVVLSACNTGAADTLQGEAVSGLGRGFFFAGARSLLVSNWAVETVSARLITTGILRAARDHAGITRAEALRRSLLALIDKGGDYAHPALWAPFSLIGDGER